MEPGQLLLYGILALWLLFRVRRWFVARDIPRYTGEQAADRLRSGQAVLVDVRTADERSQHSIPGSIHVPVTQLGSKLDGLQRYRDRQVIFYCATGSRSMVAAIRAKKAGFTAAHLEGGIAAWKH
ncbi:MAG: rhodanese-like domain-containing protein [Bacteroidetes bacterium]|jgi:rhodanese-related sulfurtransferase|nr:rhodanese-like domain-containing protein [Bacteroidota bacterium]